MKRLRTRDIGPLAVVSTVVVVILGASGCDAVDDGWAAECVDAVTQVRLPDYECDDAPTVWTGSPYDVGHDRYRHKWYYVRSSGRGSAINTRVRGGSFDTPVTYGGSRNPSVSSRISRAGSVDASGATTRSSSITRGGFGVPKSGSSGSSSSSSRGSSGS